MEFEAATNSSNGMVSPIRGILSLASDDAAAAEEAFPELAEEATVKEEEEPLPGKCSDSREGEEAGNSNVASEVKDEKEEGVRNSSSSDEVAGTTTTVTVTVATSNLS